MTQKKRRLLFLVMGIAIDIEYRILVMQLTTSYDFRFTLEVADYVSRKVRWPQGKMWERPQILMGTFSFEDTDNFSVICIKMFSSNMILLMRIKKNGGANCYNISNYTPYNPVTTDMLRGLEGNFRLKCTFSKTYSLIV